MKVLRIQRISELVKVTTFCAFAAVVNACASTDTAAPGFEVISITFPGTAFVRSYLVETRNNLILIDAGFSASDATKILDVAGEIGKPIAHILLTHGHIDHYGGVHTLDDRLDKTVTGGGVATQIMEYDAINYARFGMQPPPGNRIPSHVMNDGESLTIDDVTFTLRDAGPGESYSDIWWIVESRGKQAVFVGDIIMYGLPPFMQSGHSENWLRILAGLKNTIKDGTPIYLGHDIGGDDISARDKTMIDWQIDRITAFRTIVSKIANRNRLLTDEEIERVAGELNRDAPENPTAFNFLITSSTNVLAAELLLEAQREEFEERLQQILRGAM